MTLAGVGCHNNYEMPPPKPPAPAVVSANLHVRLQFAPQPIRQMDPTTLSVHTTDAHGKPVAGARVTADLFMPAMDMGKNEVVLGAQGPGVYSGAGRFAMDGDWRVTVTAIKGHQRAVQTFPVTVI